MEKKFNVLMSCVNMYPGHAYIPYHWALFKTEVEQDRILKDSFEWMDPIYLAPPKIARVRKTIDFKKIDILLLSLYEWNVRFTMDLAKEIKEANPNVFIIAGGPDVRWREKDWYRHWPLINASIKGDGEEALRQLLHCYLNNDRDFTKIKGLMIPDENLDVIHTGEPLRVPMNEAVSPYLEQSEDLERMLGTNRKILNNKHMWTVLETNRGCPYKCTFCDWGTTATSQKVRKIELKRILDEITWMAKNQIPNIYLADANFGILPRDIDITKHMIKCKKEFGYPQLIFFNPAKNNTDRIVEVITLLYDNGMMKFSLNLNFQTTNEEALNVMRRENISDLEVQLELVDRFRKKEIPIGASLILGCPGETKESWFKTTTDMLEFGFHNEVRVFNWLLLPNSPAADPEYLEKHKIQFRKRTTQLNHLLKAHVNKHLGISQFLVGSYSYTNEDWIQMTIFNALLSATHIIGLTKHVGMYMREVHNIAYIDFYKGLYYKWIEDFEKEYETLVKHFENFLTDDESIYNINLVDEIPIMLEIEEFIFMKMITKKEEFYKFLFDYCASFGVDKDELKDLIKYQKEIVIDLDYNPEAGKTISLERDWFTMFRLMYKNDPSYVIPYKQKKLVKMLINTKSTGTYDEQELDFFKQKKIGQKLRKYVEGVLGHRNSRANRTYFKPEEIRFVNTIDDDLTQMEML